MTNSPKTFAEKLKEHTQFLEETSAKYKELHLQIGKAKEQGDGEEYKRLLLQGEELMKSTDKITEEFEVEYEKELKWLAGL